MVHYHSRLAAQALWQKKDVAGGCWVEEGMFHGVVGDISSESRKAGSAVAVINPQVRWNTSEVNYGAPELW